MSQGHRFGYEWQKYHSLLPDYEEQFLKWVAPLTKEDFRGKTVLDAGCGMGRNMIWPLQYGAKRVVGFDLDSRSVASARTNLSAYQNASVAQGDIYTFDPKEQFDIVFSIGVIHHLAQPKQALHNLVRLLKPQGTLLIWVYGYEHNEWIVTYVNPIRKRITSRLPLPLLHMLSYGISVPFVTYLKLFKPKSPYLQQLGSFPFTHTHSIVFDQLIPEIANYWTQDEARELLSSIPELTNIHLVHTNDMSWTVTGTRQ